MPSNRIWPQLLLLASMSGALASPLLGLQQPLQAPDAHLEKRKLNGRFLHMTGT